MILAGKSAVVTGGAMRIGREIVRRLAAQGVNVCIHYGRSAGEADQLAHECRELGVAATTVSADLFNATEAAHRIFDHTCRELGTVEILINSAAVFQTGTLQDTDSDSWDRHLMVNLKAPFFLTQEFVRRLPSESEGSVVNLVDWRGERPVPGHVAYTISKSGLVSLTRLLAQELGPRVRVNGVAPGAILPAPGADQAAFERLLAFNPLKRVGTPADVVDAVIYLLTADFVTGEILNVTGGEQLGTTRSKQEGSDS